MNVSIRVASAVALIILIAISGCDSLTSKSTESDSDKKSVAKKDDKSDSKKKKPKKKSTKKKKLSSGVKRATLESGGSGSFSTNTVSNSFSETEAIDSLFEVIDDASSFGSTLVVCCFDETPSAKKFVSSAQMQFRKQIGDKASDDDSLLFAVAGFGEDTQVVTPVPVASADDFGEAISKLRSSTSDTENGIAAVAKAYADFREYKTAKRFQIMMVVVTDEAPSDRTKLDEVLKTLSDDETPLYVVGTPAPFGRQTVMSRNMTEKSLNYGPETLTVERVESDFWNDPGGMDTLDSGFGPWAWERLCRKTEGRFLAVRPTAGMYTRGWPNASRQFAPGTMSRYAPDYSSEKDYLASIESNAAKQALVNAAKLSRAKFNVVRGAQIMTGDEAATARQLLRIQQPIAAGLLPVKNLYEALKNGESDRSKLDSPRWNASYDLAMGRAAANYVRLDGANSMLAKAKSGMKFSDPSNNTWSLQVSDEINTGGTHNRIAENARKYLQGIIDDYPDTPWAYVAEQELKNPLGWEWTESKR